MGKSIEIGEVLIIMLVFSSYILCNPTYILKINNHEPTSNLII